jgi:hydroxymethylbilane synthase
VNQKKIIIGTRGSDLALWQANFVKSELEKLGLECTLHIIKTQGDNVQHLSLDKLEGKGFFTKEIEDALLDKTIDVAVHSHKDLETEQPESLVIAAVSSRADASEYLLIRRECVDTTQKFSLKKNAIVGTSSARRKSQILHYRNDVSIADIRGNVPTRVQKLRDKNYDAILLAKAGVDRLALDLSDLHAEILSVYEFVPAPAQGVLAIQCREADLDIRHHLGPLNNAEVAQAIFVERTVLNRLQGGCHLPLGVFVKNTDGVFKAHVSIAKDWNAPVRMFQMQHASAPELVENILAEINK